MIYLRVRWIHTMSSEPMLIYSELDDNRWELRKVEIYADGRCGFASASEGGGGSALSKEPIPSMEEIAADPQFEPVDIEENEFERIWNQAHK